MEMRTAYPDALNVTGGHARPSKSVTQVTQSKPYASSCVGSSLDSELIPLESGETCMAAVMLTQSANSKTDHRSTDGQTLI